MQLNSSMIVMIFVSALISLTGCEKTSKFTSIEFNDFSGNWTNTHQDSSDLAQNNVLVNIMINSSGMGKFRAREESGGSEEFAFELLVGSEKLALFSADGRQFVYKYELKDNILTLTSVIDDSTLILHK